MGFGAVLAGVSAVVGAAGQAKAARAGSRAAKENARFLEEQAKLEREAAGREADNFSKQSEIELSDTLSSFAKSGIALSGSPLVAAARSKQQAMADAQQIRQNGMNRAGLTGRRAAQQRSTARSIRNAAPLQIAGTLLGGAGDAFARSKG